MLISFEANATHRALYAFIDRVNHARGSALLFNGIDPELHIHIVESAPLIYVDDFLTALFQSLFVHRLVDLDLNFFAKSLRLDPLGSSDFDLAYHRARLHGHNHFDALAFRLGKNTDIADRTS